jgi:hypothetical protein
MREKHRMTRRDSSLRSRMTGRAENDKGNIPQRGCPKRAAFFVLKRKN